MFALFNHFKLQSNVILAASYANTQNKSLTKPRVYQALKKVINDHPQLSLTYFRRPSEKDNDKHRCWKGYLNEINLDNCVSFIEDTLVDDKGLGQIIEKLHQLWFHQDSLLQHEQTLWRLVVVNGEHAIFVYEHTIGDGKSGLRFHASLMDSLNSIASADDTDQEAALGVTCVLPVQVDKLCPEPMDLVTHRMSIIYVLYMMILFHIIRLIFRGESLLFSDTNVPKQSFVYRDPGHVVNPPTTQLQCLRLNAKTLKKCLALCREYDVTFTAFLFCVTKIGLIADLYPVAKVSVGSIPIDLRTRDIESKDFKSTMGNASSALWDITWTSEYRKTAQRKARAGNADKYSIHIPYFWTMARRFTKKLSRELEQRKRYLDDYKSFASIGADDEDYTTSLLPGLGLRQRNAWSLSNLGVFQPEASGNGSGQWSISNVEFSAGITKPGIGPNVTLNVVSTVRGGCVIYAAYEKENLKEENVKTLLEGIESRIYLIADSAV